MHHVVEPRQREDSCTTCIPQGVCASVSCRAWSIACSSKCCSVATLTNASGKEIGSSGLGAWAHPVDLRLSSQPDDHSLQTPNRHQLQIDREEQQVKVYLQPV